MIESTRLKIWTMVTHFLIIIGMGHGVLTMGFLEIICLLKGFSIQEQNQSSFFFRNFISITAILGLAGKCLVIFSIITKNNLKRAAHITGIVLLVLSMLTFNMGAQRDRYINFLPLSALPFFVCIIIAFKGKWIRSVRNRISGR